MTIEQYFRSHDNYFWQWEEDAQVIAIPGSFTIVYREPLMQLLHKLAEQGLPSFGSVLLVYAVTVPNGPLAIQNVFRIIPSNISPNHLSSTEINGAKDFLKRIAALPEVYKQGDKRDLLFQSIFQRVHNKLSVKKSRKLLELFETDLRNDSKVIIQPKQPFKEDLLRWDFRPLAMLNNRLPDEQSILNEISNLPEAGELEIPERELVQQATVDTEADLIEQLMKHHETVYAGQLVPRIMSSINIPFHSVSLSKQPLGGLADITNKGDFDQLLLSEFAYDDLRFMSRLANNEALYFNREIPPADNKQERCLLIDASLKSWGTIRTTAFAAAIAIAQHPKSKFHCEATALGDAEHAVNLTTVDGIITGLQYVDPCLSPAQGLAHFLQQQSTTNKEVIFIGSRDSLNAPKVQEVINRHHYPIDFWIYPTASGAISVYKKQGKGRKLVQEFTLPLEDLWKKPAPQKKAQQQLPIPAKYPILFANPMFPSNELWTELNSYFKVGRNRILYQAFETTEGHHSKGWQVVFENLPKAIANCCMGYNAEKEHVLLTYNTQMRQINLININQGTESSHHFAHWSSSISEQHFFFLDGLFHYFRGAKCWSVNLDGAIEEVLDVDHARLKRTEHLKKVSRQEKLYRGYGLHTMRRVRTVHIDHDNDLVINNHKLSFLKASKSLQLQSGLSSVQKVEAKGNLESGFRFNDGSKVNVHRSGMLICTSSNENILVFYIPTVLDQGLGMATNSAFAGNPYYQSVRSQRLRLTHVGSSPLKVVKVLKTHFNLSLNEAKLLVAEPGSVLPPLHSMEKMLTFRADMDQVGATVTLERNELRSTTIDVEQFHTDYIQAFINHILAHETAN